MNSSNSFNICPRCGNSNSLNAKYCSRCGAQLKVPTEAVVCHKCHTRNSSLANFCRNCGATLKVGAQTKICPRCGREIGAEENMCACGYSFVTMQQTEPRRADVSSTNKESKRDKKRDKTKSAPAPVYTDSMTDSAPSKEKKPKEKKSGRGFALFAFLILAVFVVAVMLPASARGPLAGIDKGFYHPVEETAEPQAIVDNSALLYAEGENGEDETADGSETSDSDENGEAGTGDTEGGDTEGGDTEGGNTEGGNTEGGNTEGGDTEQNPEPAGALENNVYGWDFINDIIAMFGGELSLESITSYFGNSALMMVAMFAIFILTAFFHLLVCIFRIISPKRSKRANLLYLILAVVTTVLVLMMNFAHLIPNEESAFRLFFEPSYKGLTCEYGLMIWVIPVYYWFFWLYSHIAKKKMPKKDKKDKKAKHA